MATSTSGTTIALPGFGLPLNHMYTNDGTDKEAHPPAIGKLFPNALDKMSLEDEIGSYRPIPLREIQMLRCIDAITDKENWHTKVLDEKIASTWKSEMISQGEGQVSEPMADWVIEEVRSKVEDYNKNGYVSVCRGEVIKSDTLVTHELRESLKTAVKVLENVPEKEKDWHPGSDGKVLDLVHPSLFPLIYGKSRALRNSVLTLEDCIERCGEGEVLPVPPEAEAAISPWSSFRNHWGQYRATDARNEFSRKFQWLPCDVTLNDDGKVRITSYINNLHPQHHAKIYNIVEQIIGHAIPLWNAALTPVLPSNESYRWYSRIGYSSTEYDMDSYSNPHPDAPTQEEGEDLGGFHVRLQQWYEANRTLILPEPETFRPLSPPAEVVDLVKDFKEQGLQVIVKLANIELTPDKPNYDGGSWHVEGQLNEHICASAIYYYDSHNVTESRLAFRGQVSHYSIEEGVDYEQDDHGWLETIFGMHKDGPSVQEIGAPTTPEGRLLAWPNILQHRVQPFELADKAQNGYRKILALFLVDPNIRVISTANVPVQRRDWWAEHLAKDAGTAAHKSRLASLPAELQDKVWDEVEGWPLTMEEAKELRVELMEERKIYQVGVDTTFNIHEFSLCEH